MLMYTLSLYTLFCPHTHHYPLLPILQQWRSQALPAVWGHLPAPLWAAKLRAARGEPLEGLPRLLRAVPAQLSAAAFRETRPHALWWPRAQLWADRMKNRAKLECWQTVRVNVRCWLLVHFDWGLVKLSRYYTIIITFLQSWSLERM